MFQVLIHGNTEASVRDAIRFTRRHLPEALSANYGWSGNLKRDGDQAFIDVSTTSSKALSVSLHAAPLTDPVQREAFRRFFIDFSTETNSFYAEAKD